MRAVLLLAILLWALSIPPSIAVATWATSDQALVEWLPNPTFPTACAFVGEQLLTCEPNTGHLVTAPGSTEPGDMITVQEVNLLGQPIAAPLVSNPLPAARPALYLPIVLQ